MALKVGELYATLDLDNKNFIRVLDGSAAKGRAFGAQWGQIAEQIGQKFTMAGMVMTAALTAPLVLLGKHILTLGMDAVESESLFTVSMKGMEKAGRAWSEELGKALGLNRYELRKNLGVFYNMTTAMGLGTDEAYKLSTGLTKLAYDMASFYNITPDEAFLKLRSGITGESEPLKQLGIIVNETTAQTYAYTHGLAKQGEALTESQKVLARYGVIMQSTANAQNDMARTIDSPANKLRALKSKFDELAVLAAPVLIQALDKIMTSLRELGDWFGNLTPAGKAASMIILGLTAALGPLLLVLGAIGMAAAGVSAIIAFLGTAMAAALIAAAPYIAAIIGIAAALVIAYKKSNVFRTAVSEGWEKLKTAALELWAVIVRIYNQMQPLIDIWKKFAALQFEITISVIVLWMEALVANVIMVIGWVKTLFDWLSKILEILGLIDKKPKKVIGEGPAPTPKIPPFGSPEPLKQIQQLKDEELIAIKDVVVARRAAEAERRQQMKDAIGFGDIANRWQSAMSSGAKMAFGGAVAKAEINLTNIPEVKELQAIRKELVDQKNAQDYINAIIKDRLAVY